MSTRTRAGVHVLRPSSPAEAVRMATSLGAPFVAAGTWLQPRWEKAGAWPDTLVDVGDLAALGGWEIAADHVRIGALNSLSRLCYDSALARELPVLGGLCRQVASPGVRRLATLGGNLASRGDLVPVLLALEASVTVAGADGTSTLPLDEWLARGDPPRLLCHVDIPLRPDRRTHAEKLGHRETFSPTIVTIAIALQLQRHRIAHAALAIGGGPTPRRLPRTEALLVGQPTADPPWQDLDTAMAKDLSDLAGTHPATAARGLLRHGLRQALATEAP